MPREVVHAKLSRRDHRFLEIALNLANSSECSNKHGAVLVKGGRIISTGVNRFKNHPQNMSPEHIKSCSVHAEIDSLRKVTSARGGTIYVARVDRLGVPALSRPCEACYEALVEAGISKIIYTPAIV